jgi:hypothetical protein
MLGLGIRPERRIRTRHIATEENLRGAARADKKVSDGEAALSGLVRAEVDSRPEASRNGRPSRRHEQSECGLRVREP